MINLVKEHYQWFFGGSGVLLISALFFLVKKFFSTKKVQSQMQNQTNITNEIHTNTHDEVKEKNEEISNDDNLKALTKILFVDDNHKEYKMVSILKKSGWINTKSVKDILDLDDATVQDADIIFVDINGVGTVFFKKDQGLGLASALKKKYPKKKIIIYSAEIKGDRFNPVLREVDGCLYKDADPYQFTSLIEELMIKK
ncbi:MAG: hypothetical protein LBR69_03635 [Endomicrobium sp.]|jgi:hypothetical protein|nr:hypothetical protein [Endomicrobium sp.]